MRPLLPTAACSTWITLPVSLIFEDWCKNDWHLTSSRTPTSQQVLGIQGDSWGIHGPWQLNINRPRDQPKPGRWGWSSGRPRPSLCSHGAAFLVGNPIPPGAKNSPFFQRNLLRFLGPGISTLGSWSMGVFFERGMGFCIWLDAQKIAQLHEEHDDHRSWGSPVF